YSIPIGWYRAFQFEWMVQPPAIASIAVSLGTIAIVCHLAWTILKESHSDLLNRRKRARIVFVVVLVFTALLTALVDAYLVIRMPDHAQLLKAACIWPAVGAAALWILRSSPAEFNLAKSPVGFSQARSEVDAKDRELLEQLHARLTQEDVYLVPSLTIADLAKDLGVTRHRLRNVINHSLGYENFNQFLNTFRIEAIQRRLDDPALNHVPILTLALEGGFRSIAPFNKAFKARFGVTPSAYRSRRRKTDQAKALS
ncbi:MAG: helix-turn-helix domain-containing protein, partial [Pseudomonadota bacterium]